MVVHQIFWLKIHCVHTTTTTYTNRFFQFIRWSTNYSFPQTANSVNVAKIETKFSHVRMALAVLCFLAFAPIDLTCIYIFLINFYTLWETWSTIVTLYSTRLWFVSVALFRLLITVHMFRYHVVILIFCYLTRLTFSILNPNSISLYDLPRVSPGIRDTVLYCNNLHVYCNCSLKKIVSFQINFKLRTDVYYFGFFIISLCYSSFPLFKYKNKFKPNNTIISYCVNTTEQNIQQTNTPI